VAGERHIIVVALRDIEPGDEITIDYQWIRIGHARVPCVPRG
jgi:SET domain-containing protein